MTIFTDVTGISVRLLKLSRIEQLNRLSRNWYNTPEPRKRGYRGKRSERNKDDNLFHYLAWIEERNSQSTKRG